MQLGDKHVTIQVSIVAGVAIPSSGTGANKALVIKRNVTQQQSFELVM